MGTNKLDWVRAKRKQSATFLQKYIEDEDGQWQVYEEILQQRRQGGIGITRSSSSLSKSKNTKSSSSLLKTKKVHSKLTTAPIPAINIPKKNFSKSFSVPIIGDQRPPPLSILKPRSESIPGERFRKRAETLSIIEDERRKVNGEFQEKVREARAMIKKNNIAMEHREFVVLHAGFEKWRAYVKRTKEQTLTLLQQWRFERLRLMFARWNVSTLRHARAVAILHGVNAGITRVLCVTVFREFRKVCCILRIRKQRILRLLTRSAIVNWKHHTRQSRDILKHSLVSPSERRRIFLQIIAVWRLTKMCRGLSRRKKRNRERILVNRFRSCIVYNFFEDWRTHTFKKYVGAEKIARLLEEAKKSQARRAIWTWFTESKNGPKRREWIRGKVETNRYTQLKIYSLKHWLNRYNELVKHRMAVLHWAGYNTVQSFSKWLLHVTTMRKLRRRAMNFNRRRMFLKHIRLWKHLLDSLPCDADRYSRHEFTKQRPVEYRVLELKSKERPQMKGWMRLTGRRYQARNIRVMTTKFHFS